MSKRFLLITLCSIRSFVPRPPSPELHLHRLPVHDLDAEGEYVMCGGGVGGNAIVGVDEVQEYGGA